MAELLSASQYAAIAAGLTLPTQAFVDGAFRPANSGNTFATLNPATDQVLAHVAACDATDVDDAVARAKAAFADGRWRQLPPCQGEALKHSCSTSYCERCWSTDWWSRVAALGSSQWPSSRFAVSPTGCSVAFWHFYGATGGWQPLTPPILWP